MDRRSFLAGATSAGAAGLAGCLGFELASDAAGEPALVADRPDGVYRPTHVEGMTTAGTGEAGDYRVAVRYSYPHRFWTITGETVERTDVHPDDDLHLMTSVWDPETGQVLPETGVSVEITRDGSLVSQEVVYPMLSQPMGTHYGGNFALSGDGRYAVTVSVGGVRTRRTGAFRDRFDAPADVVVEAEYSAAARDELPFRTLEDAGAAGAVEPTSMATPDATAPAATELPGRLLGSVSSDDAVLVATALDRPPAGAGAGTGVDGPYLAVSARTRYNRMLLPAMGLDAALVRNGETRVAGSLVRTLDPDLSYHYGLALDGEPVRPGDEVVLTPTAWPQTARHEGYETAFGGLRGGMPERTLTVAASGEAPAALGSLGSEGTSPRTS